MGAMKKPSGWKDYVLTLALAVVAALFVRTQLFTAYKVPTGSMQPALKPGDFIFSSRVAYGFRNPFGHGRWGESLPLRGDLVVFQYPHQPDVTYVKRIVALPGDRIQLKAGRVVINNEPFGYSPAGHSDGSPNPDLFEILTEKAPEGVWDVIVQKGAPGRDFGPIVVPPGEVFLLGDNRDASDDSRYWGTVPLSQIQGKALFIWLSLDYQNKWADNRWPQIRWERMFHGLH